MKKMIFCLMEVFYHCQIFPDAVAQLPNFDPVGGELLLQEEK